MSKLFEAAIKLNEMMALCSECGKAFDSHDGGAPIGEKTFCETCLTTEQPIGAAFDAFKAGEIDRAEAEELLERMGFEDAGEYVDAWEIEEYDPRDY